MTNSEDSLLEFPCEFPLKAMGRGIVGIEQTIIDIVKEHVDDLDETKVSTNTSRNGKYISVTIVITATSREQLDNIYRAFTDHPDVLMAL